MRAIRRLAAWACYGAGDLIWRVFDLWLGFGLRGTLYRVYNDLMIAACRLQGDDPYGPWRTARASEA